ncbi:hypothetical protein FB451DRAFT_1551512 [Mycena latifolia]|nr:hypothetical protein FB451DRAFT_1551512 [Mycena latifolia]
MSLRASDIQRVRTARATVSALESFELPCCLAGSSACYELGNSHVPMSDVDVLVLASSRGAEEIKHLLVSSDPNFFLAPPEKNPLATYKVLWYTLPPPQQETHQEHNASSTRRAALPVMPLLPALMHKVLAWIAHGEARRTDKQLNDLADISGLSWYPAWFVSAAFSGIARYVQEFPESACFWKTLESGMKNSGVEA